MAAIQFDLFDADKGDWTWICSEHAARYCRGCWHYLPECCFRRNSHTRMAVSQALHSKCRACEQERRDFLKRKNRYKQKAKDALNRHMRIERKQGLHACRTLEEYELLTGVTSSWLAEQMAHNIAHGLGCQITDCGVTFLGPGEMPGVLPLSYLTLDRPDRSRMLSRTNNNLGCNTCNGEKGRQDIHTFEVMQRLWRLRRDRAA
jgi:hypothetical protein